jgi:hypothetical protein
MVMDCRCDKRSSRYLDLCATLRGCEDKMIFKKGMTNTGRSKQAQLSIIPALRIASAASIAYCGHAGGRPLPAL